MKRSTELLELRDQLNGWLMVRMAIGGKLAVPFEVPKSVRYEEFPREEDFLSYLERQAVSLLEAYGDAREQRAVA